MFWLLIVNNLNIVNYSYDVDFQYHSIKITEYWEQYVKLMGVSQLYIYKLHSEKKKRTKAVTEVVAYYPLKYYYVSYLG